MLEQNGRLWITARLAIWRCSAMESAIRRREEVRSEVVVTMYSSYSFSAITTFLITLVGTSVSEGEVELIVLSDELVFVVVGERREGEGEGEEEEELQRESSDSRRSILQ